jgi:hypothetical protein
MNYARCDGTVKYFEKSDDATNWIRSVITDNSDWELRKIEDN